MTMKEIEQRVAKEMNDYNAMPFEGKLPSNLLELFKKSFLSIPVDKHKMSPTLVKTIASKNLKDLTNIEVRQVFNVIIMAEPEKLYKDFDSAIKGYEVISNTMIDLNLQMKKKQEEWNETKANLINLSGLNVNQSTPKLYTN